jgi:hypothetical protein
MGLTLHERVALKRDLQEHRLRAGDEVLAVRRRDASGDAGA